MKRSVAVFVSILFALSLTGFCFAQDETASAPTNQTAVQADDQAAGADGGAPSDNGEKDKMEKQGGTTEAAPVDQR